MAARRLVQYRLLLVVVIHSVLAAAAWVGAWYLRLDEQLWNIELAKGVDWWGRMLELLPWVVAARLLCFLYFELFQGLWRYVSITDLVNLIKATVTGSLLFVPVLVIAGFEDVPRLVLVIEPILCLTLVGGIRLTIRVFREVFQPAIRGGRRALIIGAGDAGEMLLREMQVHEHMGFETVGFLDDDVSKWGRKIRGVPILGGVDRVRSVVQTLGVEEIVVAMPSARGDQYLRILDQCLSTGVRLRRLPSRTSDMVRLTRVRDVSLEDILDRDPVRLETERLEAAFRGKSVLVTGAGGSIGSEVVRQLAEFAPERLVALDRSENALFFLEREVAVRHPELKLVVRVGDCQDIGSMRRLFQESKPDFVVHAAAYKHVPLMEAHPVEAVRNNVIATRELAKLAIESGVGRFLLISSDKAVRPTSMMGATKRCAELALQSLEPGDTRFMAVRFGNVLGSQGSVVPLFQRQIAEGGPVTVTHRDVVRYFMSIAEAVGLVLQASVMGDGGEVFHLDMGRPVRVLELAERLIQLSGFRPGDDIEIRFVGLRPGEKMHEELLADGENVGTTDHERIRVLRTGAPDRPSLTAGLARVIEAADYGTDAVVKAIKDLVPEYAPNNDRFRRVLSRPEARVVTDPEGN